MDLRDRAVPSGGDRRGRRRDPVDENGGATSVDGGVARLVAGADVDQARLKPARGPRERVRDAAVLASQRLETRGAGEADVRVVLQQLRAVAGRAELALDVAQALQLLGRARMLAPARELGDVRHQAFP